MKTTLPYNVYIEKDGDVILEIQRNPGYSIYSIETDGTSQLISNSETPYIPESGISPDIYYIDSLSGEMNMAIHKLTTPFDYNEIAAKLSAINALIKPEVYSVKDFGMPWSYAFADYTDALEQLSTLSGDSSYRTRAEAAQNFFQSYFYDCNASGNELSSEDFESINHFFVKEIHFLHSLRSN